MNFKKFLPKILGLTIALVATQAKAQNAGCFLVPDLEGYQRAYKVNQSGALPYNQFMKANKDSYLDTAYYVANSLKPLAKKDNNWRLTDNVGVAAPYCGGLKSDEHMFLKPGAYNTLEADRFFGKKGRVGLGALGGFTYYQVDKTKFADKYNNFWTQISGVPKPNIELSKTKNYQHFYLMVGPALRFGLGKLGLDLSTKFGPSYNDAAYVGATDKLTGQLVHRVQPGSDRWTLGGNAMLRLMLPIADKWKIGLNGNAFYANPFKATKYETLDPVSSGNNYKIQSLYHDRRQSFFGGGLSIQHELPTIQKHIYTPMEKLAPPVAAPIAVAPSLLNPCDQVYSSSPFNNQFAWKSNDNQADKDKEMFTFKLYKVPGTTPILVKTQKEATLSLDTPLPTPSGICDTDEYYYTVHSTKDASFSEMVTCSFKIRNPGASANCVDAAAAAAMAERNVGAQNVYLTRILGNENFTRQIIKYDEGKGCKCPIDTLTRKGSRLVEYFREYSKNGELSSWPEGLPIPRKASGFIYEVREVYNAENGETTTGTKRYRMNVNRNTREVTLTEMNAPAPRRRRR
jgi:hypothetical protein